MPSKTGVARRFGSIFLKEMQPRGVDAFGSGDFGASRKARLHEGRDYRARAGDLVISPGLGRYIRPASPYSDDDHYSGVVLAFDEYEIKLFYVEPDRRLEQGQRIIKGQVLGKVQDLDEKYSGITNHVHVETRLDGGLIDPKFLFGV